MRLRCLDVGVQEGGHHHEVLPHANGVLLAECSQLVLDRSIQLESGHAFGDRRLGQPRLLRCQHRTAALSLAISAASRITAGTTVGTTVGTSIRATIRATTWGIPPSASG